ncbi:MAG: anaerobic sulfite reductase subunit AsrB [Fastidiosipilaceae bacterium]|jgi:anaerobic sulfite reductase subunit B|nr:anaerobic sulfite reductase subunit AsrB [Clostridiaceae bacterium]
MTNEYIPQAAVIREIIPHTEREWTFRVETDGTNTKPGQFYEISIPRYGESPISVSGYADDFVDFTIRNVGRVTNYLFDLKPGDKLALRGPYGNGFDIEEFKNKEVIIVAGGTALSPVRGVIEYAYYHPEEFKGFSVICGFKSPAEVLFRDDIERWKERLNVIQCVDGAPEGYTGPVGMVTAFIPDIEIKDAENLQAIVAGPPVMIKFSTLELQKRGIIDHNLWVSYERRMHCGLGKCGHCKMDDTYICLDGPVFRFTDARKLFD